MPKNYWFFAKNPDIAKLRTTALSTQLNKINSISRSLSVSSFDYESSSEGIQPYLHEPNLFKATVAYDSKHELEEATNEQGKVDPKTSNAN